MSLHILPPLPATTPCYGLGVPRPRQKGHLSQQSPRWQLPQPQQCPTSKTPEAQAIPRKENEAGGVTPPDSNYVTKPRSSERHGTGTRANRAEQRATEGNKPALCARPICDRGARNIRRGKLSSDLQKKRERNRTTVSHHTQNLTRHGLKT